MSGLLTQKVTEKSDKYTGQVLMARQKQNYSENSLLISTVTDVNVVSVFSSDLEHLSQFSKCQKSRREKKIKINPFLCGFISQSHLILCVCVCMCALSHVWLYAIPWTVACQASLSMKFSRQEYWRGLPFPSPGNLPWLWDWTCISCIGRWILYCWATREADLISQSTANLWWIMLQDAI